jgi:hypothetical protein
MYLYIELWKPKDAWLKLSTDERRAKLEQLQKAAAANPLPGVIPLSFRQVGDVYLLDGTTTQPAVLNPAAAQPTGFRYAAAWMIPTKDLIFRFEKRVDDLGWWWDYFDQKNAWGEMNPQATLNELIGAALTISALQTGLGRFGRTEVAVTRLRDDVDELKRGINVVVDYVKAVQSKSN